MTWSEFRGVRAEILPESDSRDTEAKTKQPLYREE